jgi:two-component system alkaline phosphatase synthesis response regulator PhoP
MVEAMTQTILIADDEQDVVTALAHNLEQRGYHVLTARSGTEAMREARKQPDLILLDIMLPDMDGWEVARRLKRDGTTSSIPMFFVTSRGSELDEIIGFELGAADYIRKPVSMEPLMARIRYALRDTKPSLESDAAVIRTRSLDIHVSSFSVRIDGREISFPKKEFELLCYLAERKEKVISRETLLRAIWNGGGLVLPRTVDVHIRKIREKLAAHSGHIVTVKRVGYKFTDERTSAPGAAADGGRQRHRQVQQQKEERT